MSVFWNVFCTYLSEQFGPLFLKKTPLTLWTPHSTLKFTCNNGMPPFPYCIGGTTFSHESFYSSYQKQNHEKSYALNIKLQVLVKKLTKSKVGFLVDALWRCQRYIYQLRQSWNNKIILCNFGNLNRFWSWISFCHETLITIYETSGNLSVKVKFK